MKQVLGPDVYIVEDSAGTWSIDDVTTPPVRQRFARSTQAIPTFGYTNSVYWMRVALDAPDREEWLLEIANKSLDHVSMYQHVAGGHYRVVHTGEAYPFGSRDEWHRNFLFRLVPQDTTGHRVYLRFESRGPSIFPLYLWQGDAFARKDRAAHFVLGLFFGVLLLVAVYNASLFVALRDDSYFYYVLYILAYIAYQLSVERIGFAYLWPENVWWQERSNSTLALLCAVCAIQFSRRYLHTETISDGLDRSLQVLMAVCVPLLAINILFGGRTVTHGLVTAFFMVAVSALIGAGVWSWLRGARMARYYLVAWGFLLVGTLVTLLTNLGIVHYSFWTVRSVQIGSVLEVTLLSLGLGYRYNLLRRARERMRLRIASDLHDDVGSGLTQISFYSELARREHGNGEADWNERIGTVARSLVDRMQDIVWAIKPEEESWSGLELRMKDFATSLLAPHGVDFTMDGEATHEMKALAPDVRQNVLLMFKEIVHNAVRHADCTRIDVWWTLTREHLVLRVCDDGTGFDPTTVKRGNGLDNLQRRADEIQATISIDSQPGSSTCIAIDAPLQPAWSPMRI
jgi:signal transduction histidine kinase